jgi:hypothetical protein
MKIISNGEDRSHPLNDTCSETRGPFQSNLSTPGDSRLAGHLCFWLLSPWYFSVWCLSVGFWWYWVPLVPLCLSGPSLSKSPVLCATCDAPIMVRSYWWLVRSLGTAGNLRPCPLTTWPSDSWRVVTFECLTTSLRGTNLVTKSAVALIGRRVLSRVRSGNPVLNHGAIVRNCSAFSTLVQKRGPYVLNYGELLLDSSHAYSNLTSYYQSCHNPWSVLER